MDVLTDNQKQIARFAKALSHPVRIYILELLSKQVCCYSADLTQELPIARSNISQHLKELKHLGLIKGNIEGTSVCYCIDKENWTSMKEVMLLFLDQDISNENCC